MIGGPPSGTAAVFEAAFGWGWLVELLKDYSFSPHLLLADALSEERADCLGHGR